MSTIAFIGPGIMGEPMARHLIKAGHPGVNYLREGDHARRTGS